MTFGARAYPTMADRQAKEIKKLRRTIERLERCLAKTTTKLVKAKEPSLMRLKKRAWGWFSKWRRRSLAIATPEGDLIGTCFTCDRQHPWKELQAGHYIDGSICGAILNFFPRNIHPQCVFCNKFKNGAKAAYRRNMVEKYGQAKVDHLDEIRTRTVGIFKPTRQYYLSIAAKYKALVEKSL